MAASRTCHGQHDQSRQNQEDQFRYRKEHCESRRQLTVRSYARDSALCSDRIAMAKRYRVTAMERAINATFRLLTRLGVGAKYRHILTVRGRKSGKEFSTPVDVMETAAAVSWLRRTGW